MSDLKPVLDALAKLDERQDRMDLTLSKNTDHLAEHMRRTANLETRIAPLEKLAERGIGIAWASSVLLAALLALKQFGLL